MAIYSLHHQPIGKTTQARPHTSAAHVRYITRTSAASHIEAGRMPEQPGKAQAFMVEAEDRDRKNARVADKILLALPRELNAAQRVELVRGYAEEVTQGRASWLAAFHDKGKDAHNPHAHLLIRDRDAATGKRVAELSEKGSTERLRSLWEQHANRALTRAGREERIDRRTLEAQGISREPTVHEGPRAQQMERRGARPESRLRRFRNRPGSRLPHRQVDYRNLDQGRSRPAYNREIRETPGEYWQAVDSDNQTRELDVLRAIHHPPESIDLAGRGVLQTGSLPIGGHLLHELRSPSESEIRPFGLSFFDTPDHPRSDDRQSEEDRANVVFGKENQPASNFRNHSLSMGENTNISMGNAMDERDRILAQHDRDVENKEFAHNSSKSLLDATMKRAFLDPEAAAKKMQQYATRRNNREALYEKLKDTKQVFGRRPGSLLSKDYLKRGSEAKRRDADIARHNLPMILQQADKDREAWHNAKQARDDARARYGLKPDGVNGPRQTQSPTRTPNPAAERPEGPRPSPTVASAPKESAGRPHPHQGAEPAHRSRDGDKGPSLAGDRKTTDRPSVGPSQDDHKNRKAMAEARERLAREQHPSFPAKSPSAQQAATRLSPEDAKNNKAMAEARERLAREQHEGASRDQGHPSQQLGTPSFSDKLRQRNAQAPAPERSGGFSERLAALKNSPKPQQDKGRSGPGRNEEIER